MADGRKFAWSDDLIRLVSHLTPALGGKAAPNAIFDETVAALAIHRHRIGPLLYAAALPRKDEIEPAVFATLERSYRANVRQQVFTELTLQLISACFEKGGVGWMVLKGLPQARLLYCDPAYRSSSDIDILVPPRDFRRAAGILEAAGFAPVNPPLSPLSPYAPAVYGILRDASFSHAKIPGANIELHQRPFFATGVRAESLQLVAAAPSGPGNFPVLALGPDLAFYLIAHGALSHWARLKWLADLVPLFAKLSDDDKLRIIEVAEAVRATKSVAASLCLLDALFPFAALGPLRPWFEKRRGTRRVQGRLTLYTRAASQPVLERNSPLNNRWMALEAGWSFFEAPSTRARLLVLGPLSAALRATATSLARPPTEHAPQAR